MKSKTKAYILSWDKSEEGKTIKELIDTIRKLGHTVHTFPYEIGNMPKFKSIIINAGNRSKAKKISDDLYLRGISQKL